MHTHEQRQTGFIICPMLYASYGTDNNNNNKFAPYGTGGRLLLTVNFKVT